MHKSHGSSVAGNSRTRGYTFRVIKRGGRHSTTLSVINRKGSCLVFYFSLLAVLFSLSLWNISPLPTLTSRCWEQQQTSSSFIITIIFLFQHRTSIQQIQKMWTTDALFRLPFLCTIRRRRFRQRVHLRSHVSRVHRDNDSAGVENSPINNEGTENAVSFYEMASFAYEVEIRPSAVC